MDEKRVKPVPTLTPLEAMTVHALAVGQTEDEPWDVLADAVEELPLKGLAQQFRELSEPQPPYGKNKHRVLQHFYMSYRTEMQLNARKHLAERLAGWLGLERDVYWGFPSCCGETFDVASLPGPQAAMIVGCRRWVRSERTYFIYCPTKEGDLQWFKEYQRSTGEMNPRIVTLPSKPSF